MIDISPGKVLAASRVVQLIPKIAVAAVPQEMNKAGRHLETHGNYLLGFKPFHAIRTDRAHRIERSRFLLDDRFPLSHRNEIHVLSLLEPKAGPIFGDARTPARKSAP